ncbi:ATP synthase complex subunit H-domain-containing protein [Glomus cerebriforme]|uniref:ATP synthase complex subunit H-domain-containing protein n=1 Tax=Glomus cerebriforme TaxID=658196 RepID=A0A397T464_9GLOM|nr:ATP synthase complex subunit H-domain-containing protein [Glomus cerebriforme]
MNSLTSRYLRQTFCLSRPIPIVRNFTSGPVKDKIDIIQNLYIKELKSYKPTQAAAGSEVGQVKELRLPVTPEPPKIDEDISSELAAYEAEELPPLEKNIVTESFEKQLLVEEEAVHAH